MDFWAAVAGYLSATWPGSTSAMEVAMIAMRSLTTADVQWTRYFRALSLLPSIKYILLK